MITERLKPGRKPMGDDKKIQITFYMKKSVEDFLGKEYCKEFCQKALQAEYEKKMKAKK